MTDTVTPKKSQDFLEIRRQMADYAVMLGAVFAAAYFNYGIRVLLLVFCSVAAAAICRKLGEKILGGDESSDFSSLVIGATAALLLPVTAPWWMAVCAGVFAVTVCVLPFGSVKKSPFVPAAASVCFLTLCWSDKMFSYSSGNALALTKMLTQNISVGRNSVALLELLTGSIPSAVGAGSIIALAGAFLYLALRQPKSCIPVITFLSAVAITAALFPRVSTGRGVSVVMELCSGMMLFSAVFFMSYPSVMPRRLVARAAWGFAGGIICMLIRLFGAMEESVCFGILIIDAMSELFDRIPLTPWEKKRIRKSEPYVEISPVAVPEEVLNEIPDIDEKKDSAESGEQPKEEEAIPDSGENTEQESLGEVIAEENTVNETEAPFITGGDGDE